MQERVQISFTSRFSLFTSANCVHGNKKYAMAASFYILSNFVLRKSYHWTLHNPGHWKIVKYQPIIKLNMDWILIFFVISIHFTGQYTSTANFTAKVWFISVNLNSKKIFCYSEWLGQSTTHQKIRPNRLCCVQHDVTVPYLQNNEQ